MSNIKLTEREQEYFDCEVPLVTAGAAILRVTAGMLASAGQAVVMPGTGSGKAEQGLMRTFREITYTRYKKAVIRKQEGNLTKKDQKILAKLNKNDFVLAPDTYDPDEYTRQLYEEYMKKHTESIKEPSRPRR